VVLDVNGNGLVDAGEPVVPAGGVVPLAIGATAGLLITGQIPAGAVPGQTAQTHPARGQPAAGRHGDQYRHDQPHQRRCRAGHLLGLHRHGHPGRGAQLHRAGHQQRQHGGQPGQRDRQRRAGRAFILRAPVPVNTTFTSAQPATNPGAQTLYHLLGGAANSYVTRCRPAAVVDAVAWAIASLAYKAACSRAIQRQGQCERGRQRERHRLRRLDRRRRAADHAQQHGGAAAARRTRPASSFIQQQLHEPRPPRAFPAALFVQADAVHLQCRPGHGRHGAVTIVSQLTGDSETFTAVETGPNTGIFRILPSVPTANAATHIVASGDGILEVLRNDTVTATITACGGISVSATTTLLVDPSGTVYNSHQPAHRRRHGAADRRHRRRQRRQPRRAGRGVPAGRRDTGAQRRRDGADGFYEFPLVLNSTYRLAITPPAGFSFPSVLPPALQPAGRLIDTPGSYGGNSWWLACRCISTCPWIPARRGRPVHPENGQQEDRRGRRLCRLHDQVQQRRRGAAARHRGQRQLPAGFAYVRGTARLNGAPVADPPAAPAPACNSPWAPSPPAPSPS
jgi:hypothetical protein